MQKPMQYAILSILFYFLIPITLNGQTTPVRVVDAVRIIHRENVTLFLHDEMDANGVKQALKQAQNKQVASPQMKKELIVRMNNQERLADDLQKQLQQLERSESNQKPSEASDTTLNTIMRTHTAELLINSKGKVIAARIKGGSKLSRHVLLKSKCLNTEYKPPLGDSKYSYKKMQKSTMTKALTYQGEHVKILELRFLE